ncbi:protein-tyrosine-phosphatase, partial [Actinomadura sp. DSM 109109]|nr:protein-tyrosine-phosphatase [Actinomadura lepetitiana]
IGLKPGVPATAATVKAVMTVSYPRMLTQFNGQYRRMFLELLAGRVPLAFNCSAGKDRTGIAAALLLTALGVPHNTVVADYLLTNRYFDTQKIVRGQNPNAGGFAELPPDVLRAYMAADSDYIEAALKMIESHTGGAEGYFRDELGISHTDLI